MKHEVIGPFQILNLLLSIYVLVTLAIEAAVPLDPETATILGVADTLVCIVFLADFFVRLAQAPSKRAFLKWGWIDLVSSIPTADLLRWGRFVRVFRILRLLRGVRAARVLSSAVMASRPQSALATVVLVALLMLVTSSVAILTVERPNKGNITTASDAMWWSLATMTTVGYGDKFPVTPEGRIIGALVMTGGIATFGVLTASLAGWVVGGSARRDLERRVEELERAVAEGRLDLRSANYELYKVSASEREGEP